MVQPGTTTTKQDMVDWNQLLVDTSGPDPAAARGAKSSGVKGEAVVALAGLLRQGFKTLEKLDLRGCFMGVGVLANVAGVGGFRGLQPGPGQGVSKVLGRVEPLRCGDASPEVVTGPRRLHLTV